MKTVIFIPAYEAGRSLEGVVRAIPAEVYHDVAQILIQDDASTDDTWEVARRLAREFPRIQVVRNPTNLGYGGTKKKAYLACIAGGFDGVVMLHGDGQSAPDRLGAMLDPIRDGSADIVLGSRILGAPLRGGMPAYKWVGNRALTIAANLALGLRLTDYHTGYRAYSRRALEAIGLESCGDGHEISAEILVRAAARGLRIVEVPVPTIYDDRSRSCSFRTSVRYGIAMLRLLLAPPPTGDPRTGIGPARDAPERDASPDPPRDRPGITAILPCRDAARTIERTLESLAASSTPPIELICVDDASRDDTPAIVRAFATRGPIPVRCLSTGRAPRGAAAARNLGARAATGDALLFLDADIVVEPDTIGRLETHLAGTEGGAVLARLRETSLQAGLLARSQALTVSLMYEGLDPDDSPCLGTHCLLIAAATFHAVGGFDESYRGATVEDFAFGHRLRARGGTVRIAAGAFATHNHPYTVGTFLRNYYAKARDLVGLILARPEARAVGSGYFRASSLLIGLGALAGPVGLIAWLAAGAGAGAGWGWGWGRVVGGLALATAALALLLLGRDFLFTVARRAGWKRAGGLVALRGVACLAGLAGASVGLARHLVARLKATRTRDAGRRRTFTNWDGAR